MRMWRDNTEQGYSYLGASGTGQTVESFIENRDTRRKGEDC